MLDFTHYVKIKDNYCICYFGNSEEYLVLLKELKHVIEKQFPGLKIFLGCRDEAAHLLGRERILLLSQLKIRKREFAHIKDLRYDGNFHPIEQLLEETDITDLSLTRECNSPTEKCVIITKGNYPTKDLTEGQIESIKRIVLAKEYIPIVDGDLEEAGWIVGVESIKFYQGAIQGIQSTLIPTGIGASLFKKLFPRGSILKLGA